MSYEFQTVTKINLPLILQLLGLLCFVLLDPYIHKNNRKNLIIVVLLAGVLLIQNQFEFILENKGYNMLRTLNSVVGYCVRPMIIVFFMKIANKDLDLRFQWFLILINTLIYMTSFFTDLTFGYSANGSFHRGPMGYTCHVISVILLLLLLKQAVFSDSQPAYKMDKIVPIVCTLLVFGALELDSRVQKEYHVSYLTIIIVSCLVYYYVWLHFRFEREHEQAMMAEQRIQIMMSQIQPHFLFNTLSTIQSLVRTDPDKAFDTLEQFGSYLRENIDSLNQSGLIPFRDELEHTRTYADIEMTRFPSIKMDYDIQDDDFMVPALTLQPLVENAIRHGVRIRRKGLVSVSTRKENAEHVIVVCDNGKGFDADMKFVDDGKHIGIRNVMERLKTMCDSEMTIESELNVGTTVTIRIPDRGKHEDKS